MRLREDEVHVWNVSLEEQRHRLAELDGLLSVDERERAHAYRVPVAAERFVLGRGVLREILGRYAGVAPEELRFSYPCVCGRDDCAPSRRKPRLELDSQLRFNLSHSDGLAMLAVANGREVGIDVERIDPSAPAESVADRFFGADEIAALRALPPARQAEAFYRGWTRKEAYTKARGSGFALPPADIEVSLAPRRTRALRRVRGEDHEAARWCFFELPTPSGYIGALAVEGSECAVTTRGWPRPA